MKDVFETIRTVLAVRNFQDKPVPAETIQRIVEAAWLTGSSMNLQPWHFVVVEDREMLMKLGAAARTGPYTAQAAFAVVVAIEKTEYAESDASRAIQSMMLAAWAEGVGSNWVGFYGLETAGLLLGIPENLDVLAIVPFGYPALRDEAAKVKRSRKKRKPLAQVAHRGQFGRPF